MVFLIVFLVIAAGGVVALYATSTVHDAHLPSYAARRRLRSQIGEVEASMRLLTSAVQSVGGAELAQMRASWSNARLASLALEDLQADGVGATVYETLRAAGIQRPAQLTSLGSRKIASIGHKRKTVLLRAYRQLELRVQAEARALSEEQLDEFSGGKVRALREQSEAVQRANERELFEAQLRRYELSKRLDRLGRT